MGPGGAGGDKGEDLTGKVLHWDGNLLQWQTRTKTVIGAKAAWRHTAPLTETGAKERPVARQGVTANELETEQEKWDEKDAKALSIIQERHWGKLHRYIAPMYPDVSRCIPMYFFRFWRKKK
jgi:hypothetical protein